VLAAELIFALPLDGSIKSLKKRPLLANIHKRLKNLNNRDETTMNNLSHMGNIVIFAEGIVSATGRRRHESINIKAVAKMRKRTSDIKTVR
jgi:hypothetical protein